MVSALSFRISYFSIETDFVDDLVAERWIASGRCFQIKKKRLKKPTGY